MIVTEFAYTVFDPTGRLTNGVIESEWQRIKRRHRFSHQEEVNRQKGAGVNVGPARFEELEPRPDEEKRGRYVSLVTA